MKRNVLPLALLVLAFPVIAQAQAVCSANLRTFNPVIPEEGDERIEVHVTGSCNTGCRPQGTPEIRVNRDPVRGHTVFVRFQYPASSDACHLSAGGDWSGMFTLPQMPAGNYELFTFWGPTSLFGIHRSRLVVLNPRIDVQPRFGREGTEALITGDGVGRGSLSVRFDGVPSPSVRFIDADHIAAIVPKLSTSGAVDVAAGGPTARNIFLYDAAPPAGEVVRVLFPIAFSGRGAFGSDWRTENWIRNAGLIALPTGLGEPVPPGGRFQIPVENASRGLIATIPRALLDTAAFSSRIRDVSRNHLNAGTELRVITEDMMRAELVIPNVKFDEHYRYTLRVYDIDSISRKVIVRMTLPGGGEEIGATELTLLAEGAGTPGYATVELLNPGNASQVDLRITGLGAHPRLWAFVSATNNDTQLVTTYSPDR